MSPLPRECNANDLVTTLRSKIDEVLSPQLRGIQDFALVDFPDHPNVGDSAIWLGEVSYLKSKLGRAPSYVCTYESWLKEDFERAVPSGPILVHGGGNFGDLWPKHQAFREMLVSSFPDRVIVQLPQTIHFSSKSNLKKSSKIISSHNHFRLLVRDLPSLEIAQSSFASNVSLCPDMAFCLGPQRNRPPITRELLLLLRNDREAVQNQEKLQLPRFCSVEDWLFERRGIGKLMKTKGWIQTLLSADSGKASKTAKQFQWYQNLASNRVNRGLKQLGSSQYVVTDRLHAHILCILLDMPHTVLDNNYGKIGRFVEKWTDSFSKLTGPLPSLPQAVAGYLAHKSTGPF